MRDARIALIAAAGFVLSSVPAAAANDVGDLQRRIEARLSKAGLDRRAAIRVSVASGVPRLTGFAASYADSREAERVARKEAPRAVVNLLRVVPERRSDRAILEDATSQVLGWARYGAFDAVGLGVKDGVIHLQGWVETPDKRGEIEERLARIDGLCDVHNDLRIQGFSLSDVRLRREIVGRIYRSPLFERWALRDDPPVRVFVARGSVMLAGTVASRIEQAVVEQIARGTLAFSVRNWVRVEANDSEREEKRDKARTAI